MKDKSIETKRVGRFDSLILGISSIVVTTGSAFFFQFGHTMYSLEVETITVMVAIIIMIISALLGLWVCGFTLHYVLKTSKSSMMAIVTLGGLAICMLAGYSLPTPEAWLTPLTPSLILLGLILISVLTVGGNLYVSLHQPEPNRFSRATDREKEWMR